MHKKIQSIPLTRRITNTFLIFCLACLFLCLTTVLYLQNQGLLDSHLYWAVILPAMVIMVGVIVIRLIFEHPNQIDRQLRFLALSTEKDQHLLTKLSGSDQTSQGWNSIISKIMNSETDSTLASRISQSLGQIHNRKFEVFFENYPEGLVLTDEDGNILHANQSFFNIMHINDDFLSQRQSLLPLLEMDSQDNGNEISRKISQHILSFIFEIKKEYNLQKTVIRVGRHRLPETEGVDNGYLWSFRDITQSKLVEEMRNQFVFTATHELRTPLANIKAYAETLAFDDDIDVEDQKKFYNTINSEVTRLSRFVDELLNVSQMEAGALSISKKEVDLKRLFDEIYEKVEPQVTEKEIEFKTLIPPKLPSITIDKDKITACIVNLLGNAVKYTPEKGKVEFSIIHDNDKIVIEVEDNGYGIAEEELSKVFDKFFRSSDKRVQKLNGSGLGLAFTREAVRLHGGDVIVTSEIDKGTRFTLTLPVEN